MSRSLVSLVYTKFEQGPFFFIGLLVYAVGLLTFTFLLSFRLGSSIRSEAEQGPICCTVRISWIWRFKGFYCHRKLELSTFLG